MTIPQLREGGCEVLVNIVDKKQLPPLKLQTLEAMRLQEAIPKIVTELVDVELAPQRGALEAANLRYRVNGGTPEAENPYIVNVAQLTMSAVNELFKCAVEGGLTQCVP